MIHLQKVLPQHGLKHEDLLGFAPIQESEIEIISEEEYQINVNWLKNFSLGINIVPLFTNNESDFVGVFSEFPLKGKVALINHGESDFTPKFKSIASFIAQVNSLEGDWHHLPIEAFDYPAQGTSCVDESLLLDCWKLIDQNVFESEQHRALIYQTTACVTPSTSLDTLYPFLQDPNLQIVDKVAWLLGVFHQYEPAQPLIAHLAETRYKHHYLRKQFYNGSLVKKGGWRKFFGR